MDPEMRIIEELPQSETGGPSTFLQLPRLGPQRSLGDLIEDDLNSQGNDSLEMATLLLQGDENADLDGDTIKAPGSDTQDERPETTAGVTSGNRSSQYQKATDLQDGSRLAHASLWSGLFKRYHCHLRLSTIKSEAYVQLRKRSTLELPKTVYSHQRREILREFLLVHFLPVAINFTLLGLYLNQVLWTPSWPTTNVSNALQFAAKIHETLMVSSLVSVLLHHIRYKLLSPDGRGLPLGLITSPFRLLDIGYLWSQEFSAALRGLREFRLSEAVTVLINLFLFILAAVLGPASAISMLPRLGEWQITKTITEVPSYSRQNRNNSYRVYMGGGFSDIFPRRITASFIPEACDYSAPSLNQTDTCPLLGLTDIVNSILIAEPMRPGYEPPGFPGFDRSTYLQPYNITVQKQVAATLPARILRVNAYGLYSGMTGQNNGTFETATYVTTPTDAILQLTQTLPGYYLQDWTQIPPDSPEALPATFSLYAGLPQSRDSSSFWKQPAVSCFCSRQGSNSTFSGRLTFTFSQAEDTTTYRVALDASNLSMLLNDRGMSFINSSDLDITPSYSPSAAFAFTSQSLTTLCLFKAKWIGSGLSGTFSHQRFFAFQTSMENINWTSKTAQNAYLFSKGGDGWFNNTDATDVIHLDLDWLGFLDLGTVIDKTGRYSFLDGVRRACLGSSALENDNNTGEHPDDMCMACGLGAGIAEGLSKVPYRSGIHAVRTAKDASHWSYAPAMTLSHLIGFDFSYRFGLFGNWSNSTLTPTEIMANSTRLDFIVTQQLYGYSFSGITIVLAFVVLFLYVATILVHVSVMTFGPSWSSRAWQTLGEFYVLALQSPTSTSVLDSTGGGVKVSKTWQARASVQELQHGKRVGIVIVEPGQADSEEGSMSKVRPDWKYS